MKLQLSMNNNQNYFPNPKSVRNGKGMCGECIIAISTQVRASHVDSHKIRFHHCLMQSIHFTWLRRRIRSVSFNRTGVPFLLFIFEWIFNSNRHTTINLFRNYIFEFPFCRELSAVHFIFAYIFIPFIFQPNVAWLRMIDVRQMECISVFCSSWPVPSHAKNDWCEYISSIFVRQKKNNAAPLPSTINMEEIGFSINIKRSQFIGLLHANWERREDGENAVVAFRTTFCRNDNEHKWGELPLVPFGVCCETRNEKLVSRSNEPANDWQPTAMTDDK